MTSQREHSILVGCSSWSYEDWKGPFYPHGLRGEELLIHYSSQFSIVEVDTTFYRSPTPSMAQNWAKVTPKDFRFSLKVPKAITHEKQLKNCQNEVAEYLRGIEPLGDKLSSVLLQMGYFRQGAFATLDEFLSTLDDFLADWPLEKVPMAIEIRNPRWMVPKFADFLRERKVALVLNEQTWMPKIANVVEKLDPITGPFAYFRLLGDREAMEKITTVWDRVVLDRTEDLQKMADLIDQYAKRVPVRVFISNRYAGHSPASVRQLSELLQLPPPAPRPQRRLTLFD